MASIKKVKTWAEVEKDTRKYVGKILSATAGKIRDDLTEEAFNSIAYFYTSYSPKYYHRHYYNFMERSFEKYYSNPHNVIYRGGVRLTPEKLEELYTDPAPQVFDVVFAGFHGVQSAIDFGYDARPEATVPNMSPSPMERILAKRDYIADHIDKYIEYGKAQARKK